MTPTHKALTPAGEWVEGWFDYSDQTSPTIWMKDKSTGIPETVLPETVCRATGRTDSNGKMMYEGDFVQVDEWIDSREGYSGIYQIKYTNLDCAFYLRDNSGIFTRAIRFNEMDTYTLTGKNIHDKSSAE